MLPIRTSIRPYRTPYANYALVLVNVAVFLATYAPQRNPYTGEVQEVLRTWADQFMLTPARPAIWQFVSYAFLHGGFWHIFWNMFFLYLFGNNVNDKLGHIGFLCFYFAGAVFSGIGHSLTSVHPVMGASGAVAAVTGAYMVLFPQTIVTVVYWFFFIGTIDIPAMYFILVKLIILDNIIVASTPNVAYSAHLAGYAFGAAAILLMLATGLIKTTHFDLWSMLKRWNRRRTYRDMVSGGYDPFSATGAGGRIRVKSGARTPAEKEADNRADQIRSDIAQRLGQRNLTAAAELYLELVRIDKNQVLPRQYLLDIANQLAGENKYEQAAEAYEKFLEHYPDYEYVEQVQLMLGIIYARYLEKSELACRYLETARRRLIDPGQLDMCNRELSKLKAL